MSTQKPTHLHRTHELRSQLLRSLAEDVPSAGAKAATLSALGLSSALALSTVSHVASAAAGKAGGVVVASSSLLKTALMGTLVGVTLGTAAIGVAVSVQHSQRAVVASATVSQGASLHRPQLDSARRPAERSEVSQAAIAARSTHESGEEPSPVREGSESPERAVQRSEERLTSTPRAVPVGEAVRVNATLESVVGDSARVDAATQPAVDGQARVSATTQTATVPPSDAASADPTAPRASASDPRSYSAPGLSRETAQLDRIRTAVRAGDTPRALRALDAYDEQFREGVLRPEAELLRIEVTAGSGDLPRARALAGAFIARYPSSPHVSRIRKLVQQ